MQHRLVPTCLVLLLCLSVLPAMELGHVPASHRWLIHCDLVHLKAGPLGPWLDRIAADPTTAARITVLEGLTGIDLLADLDSATLSGIDQDPSGAVLALRGRFDPQRLITLAQAATGYETRSPGAHSIHSWIDRDGTRQFGIVIEAELLLLARSAAAIEASLACLDGDVPDLATEPAWAELQEHEEAILTMAATDLKHWQHLRPRAAVLRQVQELNLRLDAVGSHVIADCRLVAVDAATATRVRQVMQGLVALHGLGLQRTPDPAIGLLLDAMDMQVQDARLRLRTRLPIVELSRLLREHRASADGTPSR